jgi:hypothetical protein
MLEKDHSSVLWVISVVGLVFSTIVFLARGIVRWRVLGPEDFVLVAAQVTITHLHTPNPQTSLLTLMADPRRRTIRCTLRFPPLWTWQVI